MSNRTGALLLAAGFSNRFGSAKLLAPLSSGEVIFQQTLSRLQAAVADVVVITRPELSEQLQSYAPELHVFTDAERGMGASLAFGIQFATQWDACLICLADMPFIQTTSYELIAQSARADNIVIPHHQDKPGNPVAFGSNFYHELRALSGDAGGRPVVRQHMQQVMTLDIEDPAILADIDTIQDLSNLQASFT